VEKKDYKDTLNLPATEFPMKANLPKREPEMLERWESMNIYGKMLGKNTGRTPYVLHDGPPYANGHIHIGHALNKILKDIIVKHMAMQGRYAPYVPGWDCHGLPIELEVDKKLGKEKARMDVIHKRRLCREYAGKFVDIQREEFKRLGVFGDWASPYLTMAPGYQGRIVRELLEFVRKGYVYKGKKPVHWCPSCVTALAEAEVEHAEKESPSVFVRFKLDEDASNRLELSGREAYVLIWTTTPWTLPANLALAVKSNIDYAAVMDAGQRECLIVAHELVNKLHEHGVLPTRNVYRTFPGNDMKGMEAGHPFKEDRRSRIIEADFVSVEEGTGIVHIAPGHGEDDFKAGLMEGLDIYAPVDDYGKFSGSGVPELEGVFVFKANALITDIMGRNGSLISEEKLRHSYPHCWRCKKPVIFRATEQWFISMEHEGLRERCLREVEKVSWVPEWGKERIHGMIKGRPDWCISRQRAWGVPITVFACKGCGRLLQEQGVLDRTVELVSEHGADAWYTEAAEGLVPEGHKCPGCGGETFGKETDILDVWFDSGVSHAAALTGDRGLSWPADMYLEGSDQYRGWFQSSMLASVGSRGGAPYRTVLTHGFVVDGSGKKMSKSIGNVIAPQDIIKTKGAETLRLWVSAEDYRGDVRISNEIIARLTEAYRKIRNTSKFLLGNLQDFDGGDHSGDLLEIDRWAMSRLQGLVEKISSAYERFNFHEVYHRLYNFCVIDMSSFYLDILKDRLYTFRADAPERRAAQWVLREVLLSMARLMAPVLSFTAEEVWGFIKDRPEESVFISGFPAVREEFRDPDLELRWKRLIAVRGEVNKALEMKRQERFIGNSLEAKVVLYLAEEEREFIDGYAGFLPTLFIVSEVELEGDGEGEHKSEDMAGLSVSIERAGGEKCVRCWNWSPTVSGAGDFQGVCAKCREVVEGLEGSKGHQAAK
jgi:isoleucyl-tRNA synthetase